MLRGWQKSTLPSAALYLRMARRRTRSSLLLLGLLLVGYYCGLWPGWNVSSTSVAPAPARQHITGLTFFDLARADRKVEHPIQAMIRNATSAWEQKMARQSQTLKQAVREYRRRYRRWPPKGFDAWYAFAQSHSVQLIDEYDSIDHDIRPFFALDPALIQERADWYAKEPRSETMTIVGNGSIAVKAWNDKDGMLSRTDDQVYLMEDCCVNWLQPAQMVLSPSDGGCMLMTAEHRELHLRAAEEGRILTKKEAEATDIWEPWLGPSWWSIACGPGTRFRRAIMGLETNSLPPGPSFIADHLAAMDYCQNPENKEVHKHMANPGIGPPTIRLIPVFAHSRSHVFSDIRIAPMEQWAEAYKRNDPPWEDKVYDKLAWRGSTTGAAFFKGSGWQISHRVRMYWLSNNATGTRMVRLTQDTGSSSEHLAEVEMDMAELARRYIDFGFVSIVQCDQADGTCALLPQLMPVKNSMTDTDLLQYKYLLDLDGNGWSGRFHRLLSSNSVVLKATIFPEWYLDRIQPWVHYIPLKIDYTDLYDIMAFFAGDLDGKNHHDDLARQIGAAGKEWAKRFWRTEDMQACADYLFQPCSA